VEHPTPWRYELDASMPVILDANGECVVENEMGHSAEVERAFRRIVHAVNLHEELVVMLEACLARLSLCGIDDCKAVRALLAKAKGE
jgi:hypothetical protein